MSNRWKMVWLAVGFNLAFEYALRGWWQFVSRPGLVLILMMTYLVLFLMVEDLMVRFGLRDWQLMVLAFGYGTYYLAQASGSIFTEPTVGGINGGHWLYVNFFWWGMIQAVMTMYWVNLVEKRDWRHPKVNVFGWMLCLVLTGLMMRLFQNSGIIPQGTPDGKASVWKIMLVSLVVFGVVVRRSGRAERPFLPQTWMSRLSWLTLMLFLVSGTFLTGNSIYAGASQVGRLALKVVIGWTTLAGGVMLGQRMRTGKEISI